ncbi:unnamed protein product [Penicillium nalgiovense]|nr:unnamed protein product [Penicillium nalgiovense]CAG8113790.1 unnamed protein product [Penicillium nalgiovense]CAG8324706.1 unnamed protein product [Penicillium nalgiovense]CAG8351591.1 unnamed protein product [Penicillium nalgiovense]
MGKCGHLAFAIVSAQFEGGRGRMSEKLASNFWNCRPREQRKAGEKGPVLPRKLLWFLRALIM